MTKLRYRGVDYDTETHKKEFLNWKRAMTKVSHYYRGLLYYPIRIMTIETKKIIYRIMGS